jgi:hypothetical protein
MPEVSRFYGIVIRMYFADHFPPHFHAEYGEYEALISIEEVGVLAGGLPSRAYGLVREWALLHRTELAALWDKSQQLQPLNKIEPLP